MIFKNRWGKEISVWDWYWNTSWGVPLFFLISIILFFALFIPALIEQDKKYEQDAINKCSHVESVYGYQCGDVKIFLKTYKYSMDEIIDSQALRKQFERWSSGYSDILQDRMIIIKAEESKRSAESSAAATGFVAGMVGGSMMGRR